MYIPTLSQKMYNKKIFKRKNNLMREFSDNSSNDYVKNKLIEADKYAVDGKGLGPVNRATLVRDPKHLGFTLARYKFISKMFKGMNSVFEVGCNELWYF